MKKVICSLSLALSLCMSLGVSASAASYVADDINYQNLNGQQQAIMVYTLLPDQQPEDLIEQDFEYDGYLYAYSGMTKQEQTFNEEKLHTETITVNTGSKDLKDILAELKPTIEFDDGTSQGILALDHETIKTEAAGYKTSSYTVTATKNFTGLASNDSSLIDPTAVKNGRTLSLSNITWSVESTGASRRRTRARNLFCGRHLFRHSQLDCGHRLHHHCGIYRKSHCLWYFQHQVHRYLHWYPCPCGRARYRDFCSNGHRRTDCNCSHVRWCVVPHPPIP